ncbi:MAG TPA: SIS domain-containing protein, partial [Pyrinomonadaceae bacterium]|nr:SIS domain-containing protein [Pyrinomonadaceae bacterium]
MDALSKLLNLSPAEKESLGVVHTLPEIVQQPQTWLRTYAKVFNLATAIKAFLANAGIGRIDRDPPHVLVVGAGTSDYIGKSVSSLLQKEWGCHVQAVPSTDLLTNMEEHILPERGYLWISFSRSGDSSEGVAVLEAALRYHPQIKHLIVTCNDEGRMARAFKGENVLSIVLDDAINDRGLAMTSSFTNMVIVAQALAHIRTLPAYALIIEHLEDSATQTLPLAANICERLVQAGFTKTCFLGTGPLKGAAIESSLKVLELSGGRVMSFAESFLGLRHGPLSAIDDNTLVVGYLSSDARRRQFELDVLQEIAGKHLTSKYLAVYSTTPENGRFSAEHSLFMGLKHDLADFYLPPLAVLVGQFLGFFSSLKV